jgi:flavodoxin I
MKTIGIFYGSTGGNTENVAKKIASRLGVETNDLHDVGTAGAEDLNGYEVLLFGSSTWGIGDLQDDWEGFIRTVGKADLSGKKVALFGCGDSASYPDSFCEALGKIYAVVKDKATVIGLTGVAGYSFDASEAVIGDRFAGLPLDEDNESDLTEGRLDNWIAQLKNEF